MTQTSRILIALLVTIPAACMTGPSAESFKPEHNASGVRLAVSGRKASVEGELLEVRENELVVLEHLQRKAGGLNECAVLVDFRQVRAAHFSGASPKWGGGMPTGSERAELRLLSRFPKGIASSVLQQLSCPGGTEPEVVTL